MKRRVFRHNSPSIVSCGGSSSRTNKTLFLTMVTSNGLRDSPLARQLISKSVTVDALFSRGS